MSWIRLDEDGLAYSRRLAVPQSFEAWAAGPGKPLIDAVAARRRFTLLGKVRAARKDLWAMVRHRAERGPLADAIHKAVAAYLPMVAEVASLPVDLPRVVVSLRRVVVVPRVVCSATARDYVSRVAGQLELPDLESGDPLREYFSTELLAAIDETVLFAATTLQKPVPAADGWVIVDADHEFSWWVPLAGDASREWRGHYVLYEAPPGKLTRAARKDLARQIASLPSQLTRLSRQQRNEIVTQARGRMREMTARAFANHAALSATA
jgi:hypothetical protein